MWRLRARPASAWTRRPTGCECCARPEITRNVEDFERAWTKYDDARDDIMSLILVGNVAAALRVESARGQPAFASALASLHALKTALASRAQADSLQVNATLWRSIGALAAFVISTLVILGVLLKTNRSRKQALESLHAAHKDLTEAREIARQRVAILEMVTSHTALLRTLESVAMLASRSHVEAGAAVWTGNADQWHLQVAGNLPSELATALALGPQPSGQLGGAAADYRASPPKELREASGEQIGAVQMFAPSGCVVSWEAMLDQMAQLASVAIENSLLYERLAFQAQHDTLTGLPNRLLFQDRVQQATRLALRHHKKAAVIWIDLDKYKQINDTLGHRAGDEVLCELARRLPAACGKAIRWRAWAATSSRCWRRIWSGRRMPSKWRRRSWRRSSTRSSWAPTRPRSAPAWESACSPTTAKIRSRCCATPIWPCTARSEPVAESFGCSASR